MKVAMVKHTANGKVFWFEVPDGLGEITPNSSVMCDTARGRQYGTIVGAVCDESDVHDVMVASGASLPLRKITDFVQAVPMDTIKIPEYMARTKPSDNKIAKRFLEYYHNRRFDTAVMLDNNGLLKDGYSAYLVAKLLHFKYLYAIIEPAEKLLF